MGLLIMKRPTPFLLLLLALPLVGCPGAETTDAPTTDAAPEAPDVVDASDATPPNDRADAVTVAEAWLSPFDEADNVDSVAFWQGETEGTTASWIVATGKESHGLLVYDADTGALVRRVGGEGDGPGQFRRPNGIMIAGDLALVVERDNHRVQVLLLPAFEPRGMVGVDVLRRPYGATVFEDEPGVLELYVTDNYETLDGEIPPPAELGERVKHFRVFAEAEGVSSELVRSFGDTEGLGVLTKVETLLVDDASGRLLIADEHETGMVLKVYTLDGQFTGETVGQGHFFHEAEGLALRYCGESGYWIATDQAPDISLFRVFDHADFTYRGTFVGETTANTDGVTQTSMATDAFPNGAFFAVHDDQGVTAFDWWAIAEGLGLGGDC